MIDFVFLTRRLRVIIGAGPAGLMAAWWMARCGINTRIIDKRGNKVINGHADGLRPRTDELFDSMGGGIREKIAAESYMFENMKNWVCPTGYTAILDNTNVAKLGSQCGWPAHSSQHSTTGEGLRE
jgi:2-polyprenyl-6-methoxyphenol hydroxylase-like FAD-dependent oxidoreductase